MKRLKEILTRAGSLAISWVPDAVMVAGASAISYGAWQIYEPAGSIVGGALALTGGVLLARSAK